MKAERLKELIDKEATIYDANYGGIIERGLKKECYVKDGYIWCKCKKCMEYCNTLDGEELFPLNDNMFETKSEAEFVAKYKNIQRTETLDLPTWEESSNENGLNIDFVRIKPMLSSPYNVEIILMKFITLDSKEYVRVYSRQKIYFTELATEEYYLEACEICRKLFLGEEV